MNTVPCRLDDEAGTPQVSVVIPARNASETLGVQLEALARQQTDRIFEVLVADNGSTDSTAEVVASMKERLPRLELVSAARRAGTNVARNVGSHAARGTYVLLCDADDEVDPGWLEAMAQGLDSADCVGGSLERHKLNPHRPRAGGDAYAQTGVEMRLGFLRRPMGANAGYRKAVWEALGGFNEEYVRGGTETEFFWRAQLAGFTLVEVPEAIVHYRMRDSVKASVRQKYIWGRQSPMLYRDFRAHGLRYDPVASLRDWAFLAVLLRRAVRSSAQRAELMRYAAYRFGSIVGSVKYRVFYL